jgi:hypothetical protein
MSIWNILVIIAGVGFFVCGIGSGSAEDHALLIAGSVLISGGTIAMSISCRACHADKNKDKQPKA